jgi:DNA polymerase-3 subunit epsilon
VSVARLAKRLLVIDLETTGLDPAVDSPVQLASCLLSRQELREEAHFCSYVRPESEMSVGAARIHGLSATTLARAPSLADVVADFADYAPTDAIVCGHNVGFDVAFLKMAYKRVGRPYPFDYHTLDLWSVAFFVLGAQGVSLPAYDLNSLCSLYSLKRGTKHDALEDVRATASVLRHLFATVKSETLNVTGQFDLFSRQ